MGKFQEILDIEVNDFVLLPLLHTCDAFAFRSIIDNLSLKPQLCDVFSSDLLYTYYGVPSYRINYNQATRNAAYFPICIILDSSKVDEVYKIYPFDSGAFQKKPELKQTFFHHETEILEFELEAHISSAMRVIKTFYESNENYIFEKPNVSKEFSDFDFEAVGYKNLINDQTNNRFDNRASSIEVIFNNEIPLTNETVKQIIIPNRFKDDSKISGLINKNFGIGEALGYDTFRGSPNEYFGQIRELYLKFLNLK